MGDILFHFTREEERLLFHYTVGATLASEQIREAKLLEELNIINDLYATADTEKSADGYGVEDRNKV